MIDDNCMCLNRSSVTSGARWSSIRHLVFKWQRDHLDEIIAARRGFWLFSSARVKR